MTDEEQGRAWLKDNLACEAASLDRLTRFATELRVENEEQNLIARGSVSQLWWRHIVDSAQLLVAGREYSMVRGAWMDLGSGAGFPGLVIGILEPSRPVMLVEQRRRRINWLRRVVDELALAHISVIGSRLEAIPTQSAAVISARAFAPLPKLLKLSQRFSTPDTIWMLPKGETARQEIEALPGAVQAMFHVKQSVTNARAGIIVGRGVPEV